MVFVFPSTTYPEPLFTVKNGSIAYTLPVFKLDPNGVHTFGIDTPACILNLSIECPERFSIGLNPNFFAVFDIIFPISEEEILYLTLRIASLRAVSVAKVNSWYSGL